eukprot:gene7673-8285_t
MSNFAADGSQTKFKVGVCQILVGADKQENITKASNSIDATTDANLVVLPECWNSPYGVQYFPAYAEPVPNVGDSIANIDIAASPSSAMLLEKAQSKKIWIVGGSIPERGEGDVLYNTCIIINPEGQVVGKHRKVHLFDINLPGKITFKESDSLSPGGSDTLIESFPWGGLGVGICYDIRFPEYAMMLRQKGAKILVYPGAFNMVTGPAHWELLQRARAVDNQVYVITCSPAREEGGKGYIAWGHSTVVSPWGDIVAKAGAGEEVIVAELELKQVEEMRENIPCWRQKRQDLYELKF